MTDCVFCDIIKTEVAEGFIDHEYWHVVSFVPLNPVTKGHRLFVPKPHFESAAFGVLTSGHAFTVAAEWANHHREQDFNIITSGGKSATQTVFHTHIHYVPRREGDGLLLPWSNQKVTVTCICCKDEVVHRWHYFDGCDCAAAGCGTNHSSHCSLYGLKFLFDERWIN